MVMRSVVECEGSKIEHLLARKKIDFRRNNSETFAAVMHRVLRHKPMPAEKFRHLYLALLKRYRPTDQGLRNRDCYCHSLNSLTGYVRLVDGKLLFTYKPFGATHGMSRDIYRQYCDGDRIPDDALSQAIEDYRAAEAALFKLGPAFEVSRKAITNILIGLEQMSVE